MRGPRVWTHFRYRFPAISEMTIRPPRPTNRVYGEGQRERVSSNRQSVAGCISPEERREREREGEGVLLKRRPFDEARPLLRDRERARILLK